MDNWIARQLLELNKQRHEEENWLNQLNGDTSIENMQRIMNQRLYSRKAHDRRETKRD